MVLYTLRHNLYLLLVALLPLVLLFAAHECATTGYFLSTQLHCARSAHTAPVSNTWPRLWLVLYYYALCKYSTMIESRESWIKV
jgi:hypothetical protein